VFATLEEVVEFYNRGGGAGLGLQVPNQTLPFDHLSLTEQEKTDLVSFLKSLTDTSATRQAPERLPAFPAGSQLNKRAVGGSY
jgi:cytochrome c peroxidase